MNIELVRKVFIFALGCLLISIPTASGLDGKASCDYEKFTIRRVTRKGERPAWSPDGKKLALIQNEFGEALELDLRTKRMRCLTCGFSHDGFLRVHYLKNGDYILTGPMRRTKSQALDRIVGTGLWYLSASLKKAPIPLHQIIHEGVAVSRESFNLAWTITPFQGGSARKDGFTSHLFLGHLEFSDRGPVLVKDRTFKIPGLAEAQDFFPGDEALLFTHFEKNAEVKGINLRTGKITNYSLHPAYDEAEGIFPNGKFACIESNRHKGGGGLFEVISLDIYLLKLDGKGFASRLTRFSERKGIKASNPVVSPDGRKIAFMQGVTAKDPKRLTGEGEGIFLLEFACP